MSGRRAAIGVAFKNARRNKKRTLYLVALIGLPVLVAVTTSAFVRASYVSPEEQAVVDFGSADVRVGQSFDPEVDRWVAEAIEEIDPDASTLSYREIYRSFGTRLGGSVVDIDLSNPIADGLLRLTTGREPEDVGEVVLSEHLASELGVTVGDTASLPLRGNEEIEYLVVGLVSHPVYWSLDQVVVAPSELDLQQRDDAGGVVLVDTEDEGSFASRLQTLWERERYRFYPDHIVWPKPEDLYYLEDFYYAEMTSEQIEEVRSIAEARGVDAASAYVYTDLFPNGVSVFLPEVYAESRTERLSWAGSSVTENPSVIGTAVAAVILAEVAFIAGAAFATGTRRRLREIGLMGANGADIGQVKASVVGEGLVAGMGGGLLGAGLALALLVAGRPYLQRFVDRRIEEFPLSAVDLAGPILVAVAACLIAAWLPAKTASGVPTLTALQGRMPVGQPKRWVIPAGLAITGFGTLLLAVGLGTASQTGSAVALIGAVLMIGGAALLAGPIVAWVSKHAERFPITSRIVLRDSGRQRGRAAAAVAATMVILMAPVAALAAMEANEASQTIYGLRSNIAQSLVEGRYDAEFNLVPLSDADLAEIEALLPGARIASFDRLDIRVDYPAELEAQQAGNSVEQGGYYVGPNRVGVANAELLAMLDDPRIDDALAADGLVLVGVEERETTIAVDGVETTVAEVPVAVPQFSFPRLLVTEEVAQGWEGSPLRSALVQVDGSFFQNPFGSPFAPLWETGGGEFQASGGGSEQMPPVLWVGGFLATMLIVLIVVATVTALSAAESDEELRTVVAVGATNSIRRKYLGLQSGLHTLIGAVLAVPLTLLLYKTVMMASGNYQSVGNFDVWNSATLLVPWGGLALVLFGLPLAIGLVTAAAVRSAPTTPPRRAT